MLDTASRIELEGGVSDESSTAILAIDADLST